ncbi:toprim domain-containing protein [Acidithiobacillus sulfurivorans]|uniref:Topoisomerase n=1 Tax=Acidithiobacillus sulfurivorans TaxID=1958756 RepID=A0ABS5ZZD7_9PROT|nr:toprim domain-containing protein [Acidithiobacillus sulfurivorans]MBU2760582.1 topoisomerase [Acidithiobacillus sulfurivorans]
MGNNPIAAFRDALAAAGVILHQSETIRADGVLHRARSADDKAGKVSCWYRLHLDAPVAGAGGSWKSGASVRWCSKRESALTAKERAELAARILRERAEAQAETERRHKDAARRALRVWNDSAPAAARHPYLERKGIAPGIARQSGPSLVLPVQGFTGKLWGLQFINEQGGKRFLSGMKKSGCFIRTGDMPAPDGRLIVCEGWATGQTLAALSPGACVIAGLDAGNLQAVATEGRRLFPALDMVIAADLGEVGLSKAKSAAIASRSRWIWPSLPADAPAWVNDFNDWHAWRKCLRQAVAS